MTDRPRRLSLAVAFALGGAVLFAASLVYFLYAYLIVFARPAPAGSWLQPAAFNTLLFSVFALHHSIFARTPLRAAVKRWTMPALERSVYTWTASLLFFGVCVAWQPVPGTIYELSGPWWWVGVATQAAGIVMTQLGSRKLDILDLAGVRQVFTPSRDAAGGMHVPLETRGVYAIVRHPIYFGWVLLVFGAPLMTATRFVFAVVSTVYLVMAIPFEERSLVDVFGDDYKAYRRRVRSRIVPGVW